MNPLLLNVHGISVELSSDKRSFVEFCERSFRHFVVQRSGTAPLLRSEVLFSEKKLKRVSLPCQFGREIRFGHQGMLVKDPCGLEIYVEPPESGAPMKVTGDFHESPRSWARKLVRGMRHSNYQVFTEVMRLMLHQPIFYQLQKKKGYFVFHSAAVSRSNQAWLFFGFSGGGKSTLSQYLARDQGFKILSDNYLLIDKSGGHILSFIETLRLSIASANLLGIKDLKERPIHGRFLIDVPSNQVALSANPAVLFFVARGKEFKMISLPHEIMVENIESMQAYTHETVESSYLRLLDSLVLGEINPLNRVAALRALCVNKPCYLLVVPELSEFSGGYEGIFHNIIKGLKQP